MRRKCRDIEVWSSGDALQALPLCHKRSGALAYWLLLLEFLAFVRFEKIPLQRGQLKFRVWP